MDDYFKFKDANDTYVNEVNDEKEYFNDVIIKAAAKYYTAGTGKVIAEDAFGPEIIGSFRAIQDQFKNYSSKDLTDGISSKSLTKQQNLMQVAILMDMLDYREQASKLSNFVRGISYDTNKTKNLVENYLQRARYNIAVNDNFVTKDSINRVFDNTFLGKVKEAKDDVLKMFEKFFVVLNPKSLPAFDPILEMLDDDKLFMSNDAKADLLNRYQNFFLTHILQNTTFGNNEKLSQYYDLFTDGKNESLAKRLKKMKLKYPDSVALKNFYPLINQNRNSTDGIKMFNNKMSPYEINSISESIDILHTQAEMTGDVELKEFIDNLARFAILQSGVQLSPITFTKVLPIDLYAGLTADIFRNFSNDTTTSVDVAQIWKAFHQNNWKNNKIVKTVKFYDSKQKAKAFGQGNNMPVFKSSSSNARNEFIKITELKEGIKFDANVPYDQKFKVTVYQRIKITNALGEDITLQRSAVKYRPINKLGNGMYLMETTPDPLTNASRFDINDDVSEDLFEPGVQAWRNLLSTAELAGDRPEFDKLPGRSATPTMTYAGIGSRQTPQSVINQMTEVAKELQSKGYTLNTGKTFGGKEEGADQAFSMGTTKKNLFAPEGAGEREKVIAREIHPAPDALSDGGMKLMARNTNQIFGANLDTPVDFVLFYAEDKGKKGKTGENRPEGGTGQAVEMARAKGIPTINMQDTDWKAQLDRVLNAKPAQVSTNVEQKSLGSIKLNIIEDWVQSGQATTTVRSNTYHKTFYKGDGVYRTEKGNTFSIKYLGLVQMKENNIVGDGISYTKDEFAKKEGYGTWENFKKDAKYAGKNLMRGEMVHMYEISSYKLDAAPVQTSTDIKKLNGIKEFIKLRFGNLEGKALIDAMLEDKKEMFEDTIKLFMELNPNMSKEELNKGIEEIKNSYNYTSVDIGRQATEAQKQEITNRMPEVINETAKKYLPKEQFKTRQATQYIGEGSVKSSTDNYKKLYAEYGLANTGVYNSSDLIYVSSNGTRGGRVNPVENGVLQFAYKNIDKAIAAGAKFIMDTAAHVENTKSYNVGEVALAKYLTDKGYIREDKTGIWVPGNTSIKPEGLPSIDNNNQNSC
jgi:hypothetical protein